eukprot:3302851-Pleurochrysis_carterae.AAC.1
MSATEATRAGRRGHMISDVGKMRLYIEPGQAISGGVGMGVGVVRSMTVDKLARERQPFGPCTTPPRSVPPDEQGN